jgi:tyrosyl-tRNA synthetase
LDNPDDMFGKIMSAKDELVENYFIHSTRIPKEEISEILKKDPRDVKLILAEKVTEIYHSEDKAEKAKDN